jgi:two-component system, NarL family, response regulator LiaR
MLMDTMTTLNEWQGFDFPKQAIRVLIVDDNSMVRQGVALFMQLFDDIEVVGTANNGAAAIEACGTLQPDVVLMDVLMPVMDGIAATGIIHERWPDMRVIGFTNFRDEHSAHAMMACGAVNYVQKEIGINELADVIRKATQEQY